MSVTILSSEGPFAEAVNEARPSDIPLEATVNPVGRFWNTVRLPYAEYLNETVADSVYLYLARTSPDSCELTLSSRVLSKSKKGGLRTNSIVKALLGA